MKFLLDTNVISEIRKRDRTNPNVARWVARTPVTDMGTSVLVLAEIRHGIELLRRRDPEQSKSYDRWFTQFQNVAPNNLEQFRIAEREVILWPERYRTGTMIYPYSEARK